MEVSNFKNLFTLNVLCVCSANNELSEFSINFIAQVNEVGFHVFLGLEGILELHLGELKQVLLNCVVDDGPGDLLV